MGTATAPKSKPPKMPAPPKGYREARSTLGGFFARKVGNSVTGILRGSFTTKGKFGERRVFRIEVTDGMTACEGKDGETECGIGETVGVDETGYTKKLGDFDPGQAVFLRYIGKGASEKDPHVFQVCIPE